MKKSFLMAAASLFLFTQCNTAPQEKLIEKHAEFPEGVTIEEKVDIASRLVPTPQQLEWQKMELTAFLHFGVNGFTGNEWGSGKENPEIFNPTNFDAEQWVKVLKKAGFKMALITAKHHDGFCLWPTKTTKHSVVSSKWMDGKGDVVKALKDACDKHGLRFGVYLSPWDRNAECYGTPEYNDFFVEQLTELLTQYGEVYEVWFDGANGEGPNGKKQEYDWVRILAKIRELQPKAVTAIMGDDVRWIGNESGLGRETEWSATPLVPSSYARSEEANKALGIDGMSKALGDRDLLAKAKEIFWYPSEVDVSIRPGWFYHKSEDSKVRSLENLVDIYYKSVGMNSVLLLNIPPDTEGRINAADEKRLYEFQDYISKTFSNNLVKNGNQAWVANVNDIKEYELNEEVTINTIMLQEDISKGQRVEMMNVEVFVDGNWKDVTTATTIGFKRLLKIEDVKTSKIRLTLKHTRNTANICNVGAFYAQAIAGNAVHEKLNEVSAKDWKVVSPADAKAVIDGNTNSNFSVDGLTPIVIDMAQTQELTGFTYTPVQGENKEGTIFKYNFYVSADGKTFTKVETSGEFSNINNNPIPQFVRFKDKVSAQFIKLEPVQEINGKKKTSLAEIGVLVK